MKFRKRPVVVEATQWNRYGDHPEVRSAEDPAGSVGPRRKLSCCQHEVREHGAVTTLEGGFLVCPGDWIIMGVKGEYYPCKPDIFAATYEPVEESPEVVKVTGPGGCVYVTAPDQPHLGGNFDGGDSGTQYLDDLWPWLVKRYNVRSMVDVGCGTGETAHWFLRRGVDAHGVDGLAWNARQAKERLGLDVFVHDFQKGPFTTAGPCDLIWCCDVAEHIEEKFAPHLLETLRHCRVLAFCHGLPENADQGYHHVNCQPEEYWVRRLAEVGMVEDPEATAESRRVGNHGWWPYSGRIYVPAGTR